MITFGFDPDIVPKVVATEDYKRLVSFDEDYI